MGIAASIASQMSIVFREQINFASVSISLFDAMSSTLEILGTLDVSIF